MTRQSDLAHDNKVFYLSQQYVIAYRDLTQAINKYGIMSDEVGQALAKLNVIKKQMRKQKAADNARNRRLSIPNGISNR